MSLRDLFNNWAQEIGSRYQSQQWLLSKWDTLDGVAWPEEKIELMLGHIQKYLQLDGGHRFLDVGCGGGWLLDRLAQHVEISFGCDVSMAMLRNTSGRSSVFNADAIHLPIKSDALDRILCYFVFINFMELDLVESAVREMLRVLEPGGRMLIGQLPDRAQSSVYDQEKKAYLQYCYAHYPVRRDTRDQHVIPIQLFQREFFAKMLEHLGCDYQFIPAFNPFYRPGQPSEIDWRFDIIVEKK